MLTRFTQHGGISLINGVVTLAGVAKLPATFAAETLPLLEFLPTHPLLAARILTTSEKIEGLPIFPLALVRHYPTGPNSFFHGLNLL
jgi:hypothetical protein